MREFKKVLTKKILPFFHLWTMTSVIREFLYPHSGRLGSFDCLWNTPGNNQR